MFETAIMESLGRSLITSETLTESSNITKQWHDKVTSNGGTTTKPIQDPSGGEKLSQFVQRISDNTVLHFNRATDKDGNTIKVNQSMMDISGLGSDYVSTKIDTDKKLKQMAKAFGINVKNTASDVWKNVKKTWANILKIEAGPLAWLDVTKIGNTAKTTAKKKEFDALKKALYDNGVLSESAGSSFVSGTWTSPATLNTISPFKGDVAKNIIDYYLNNYVQFSDEDATTIRNTISDYLARHPDMGIFTIFPCAGVYLGFYVIFADAKAKYDITINGKPETGSTFLFGHVEPNVSRLSAIRFDANVNYGDDTADENYIYSTKLKLSKSSEITTDHIFYRYEDANEYVAPVFDNGVLTDKFIDTTGKEHTISGATTNYTVAVGYDGKNVSSVTREEVELSDYTYYRLYSLAPISIYTDTDTLKDYIGKSITEIIKEQGKSQFYPPIVTFSYGMRAGTIASLADTVNFEKTDSSANLPEKNVDIMDQYANTWAKEATPVGDVYLKDGTMSVGQDVALPFPMAEDATQAVAQAGTGVYDYAASKALAGAETIAASVPATAAGSIAASIAVPTIVPIPPIATIMPEVLSGGSGAGLWQMYNPSTSEISAFGKWLWEEPVEGLKAPGDTLKKLFQNPMDAIISLHRVYVTPNTGGSQNIKVGYLDSGVAAPVITNRYVQKNMGSVTIKSINGNFMDYDGIDLTIYLPFIGMRPLDTSVCMGATLTLIYNIDILTGTCVAMLSVSKNNISGIIYQWAGSMFESVPLTSSNMTGTVQGALGLVGSAVTTIAGAVTGSPAGIGAGVMGMARSATNTHTNIQSCGSIGGNAGSLASRTPYIVLAITQTYNPYNWQNIKGLPDNITTTIGSQHGYIEGENPTGYSGNMSQSEWNEFESLLAKGIYV
jgi:hypothetical protein